MALEPIFDVTTQNFQAEVVQRSRDVTVMLYFWTDQVPASVEMKETMEQLAGQYQGKFVLGEVDVAREPMIAQQLRVRGVPSLKVLRDGQLVDELEGPQGEAVLREMMDRLTMSSSEKLRDDLQVFLDEKRYDQALAMLQQALQGEPDNPSFKVELADVLILTGDLDSARQLLASLDEAIEERDRPAARLEFM